MEEETALRKMMQRMLENKGISTLCVPDTNMAAKELMTAKDQGQSIDIVILDLNIAGKQVATKALEQLKTIDPNIKAIAFSGNIYDEVILKHDQYGFQGALAKPFDKEELFNTVLSVLDK